jgi:hypothetical protein
MAAPEPTETFGAVALPTWVLEQLQSALKEMDRFQQTQDSDEAFAAMIAMLRHLRVVRRSLA